MCIIIKQIRQHSPLLKADIGKGLTMKRILTLLFALVLTLSLAAPAAAVSAGQAQDAAQLLYNLNLFRGVGTNPDGSVDFDLERAPTRAEAVTMLVRLLGAEDEALKKSWKTPFTDLPDWAKPYAGYAYETGLTKGISDTQFGASAPVTAAQYLTFLLRALGYRDGTDFVWNAPWQLTDKLGMTNGEYGSTTEFLRGDAAWLSERVLYEEKKGSDLTLLEHLLAEGAIQNSSVVVWDYAPVIFEGNVASFLFYPVAGSPANFTHFKLDKITVNGLGCASLQVNTPREVAAYMASISQEAGGFCYVEISYDQAAAVQRADRFHTDGSPLLGFTFTYTGTRQDGTKVTDTFTNYFYLDTND